MSKITCLFHELTVEFGNHRIFSALSGALSAGITGLVGRNGQGKSLLLNLLAGRLAPSFGTVKWFCPYYYAEQISSAGERRIADALGIASLYDCFCRIEHGSASLNDLNRVADLWHLPEHWQSLLDSAGLSRSLNDKLATLSGGQQTRLVLCAAFMQNDCFLLLDEPSNHLDASGRDWLIERLEQHSAGALIVSHDRALLRQVNEIIELSSLGLRRYGGNYDVYQLEKQRQTAAAEHNVDIITKRLRKENAGQQASLEKAAQRRKQGERLQKSGSQSKMLMDKKKESAQRSSAKSMRRHQQSRERLNQTLQTNKAQLPSHDEQRFTLTHLAPNGKRVVDLRDVVLPVGDSAPINLSLFGGEKIWLKGDNGSGKSTLLKVIQGIIKPKLGECRLHGNCVYLDQQFSLFDPASDVLNQLHRRHPAVSLSDWRIRLANIGLRGDRALLPVSALSAGERLKAALLAVTGAITLPDLLLLDEPENYLDLDSRLLLQNTLADYRGAMIVVSHDLDFINALGLTESIMLSVR
jgi:ATPase subunit of ABC transporter with duplicated ATPase domains